MSILQKIKYYNENVKHKKAVELSSNDKKLIYEIANEGLLGVSDLALDIISKVALLEYIEQEENE